MVNWILARLKEPSTWRGLSILVGALGVSVSPERINDIGIGVMAAIGIIESLRNEDK